MKDSNTKNPAVNIEAEQKKIPTHRLIVHGIVKIDGKYLVLKRTEIKRGWPNSYPKYWDIPGGTVEPKEAPRQALIREVKEEANLDVDIIDVVDEGSNYDAEKGLVFTRLTYTTALKDNEGIENIELDPEEHTEYRLISSLDELGDDQFVPDFKWIFNKTKDSNK